MNASVLTGFLMASAILVAMSGNKLTLPGGKKEMNGNAERILLKTGAKFSNEESKALLKKKLVQADINIEPEYFLGLQVGSPIISMIALLPLMLAGVLDIFFLILPALLLFFAPRIWLNGKAKARVMAIEKDLPDFCVTFASVLKAGADFLTALTEVSSNMTGELSKEFLRAVDDMSVGKRRSDALFEMAARCSISDLTDLVRVIDQSERYGTEKADAIKHHAEKIMTRKKYDSHKKAGELTIKLLPIILIFCLLPMMGLLFFPVMYHLGNAFG